MGRPGLFFVYFRLFKQTPEFLQQIYVKNVHPVYTAGIRTHDLHRCSRPNITLIFFRFLKMHHFFVFPFFRLSYTVDGKQKLPMAEFEL